MPEVKPHGRLDTFKPGAKVTRQEIEEVLANDGYTAGARKTWLKSLLTDVTKEQARNPSSKKQMLIGEIKAAVDHFQNGKAITDENL